ncbi:MAG TPA: type VI secretion system protein TssA [Bryobacteraceae bacterium]|nr:type VI secretion system protein TssA [Bryobacteraceae bacterium]
MPLRNDLLNPIPGDSPTGKYLKFDPIYDQIREARREEQADAQGEWQTQIKVADWALTIKLISNALATKTKDLQLAVWLAQALLKKEGIESFRDGLEFVLQLMETFWDGLWPAIEDDDLELRKAPIEWMGTESDREPNRPTSALRFVPLTKSGLTYVQCIMETREVGTEDAADTWDKQQARKKKIEEGKTAPEAFDKEFEGTPKAFYAGLEKTFDSTLEILGKIEKFCDERFGDESPSLRPLRNMLIEVRTANHVLLVRKREKEPDPEPVPEAAPQAEATATAEEAAAAPDSSSGAAAAPTRAAVYLAPLPGTYEDAVARVVAAARFMRQQNACSPTSYLMLRGLRWGELRASGAHIDAGKLAPPPPEIRQQLKRARMDSNWPEMLEAAEMAMGMECGRGWLDLQRYTVLACQELGGYYEPVRRAVMLELASLLESYPQLPEMTLMDDMPTANPETQAWIRKQVLRGSSGKASQEEGSAVGNGASSPSRSFEVAMQAAKAGRLEVCTELLNREIALEPSGRGRFQRKIQLARLSDAAGNGAVAVTLLQEAAAEIEQKQLEQWESREMLTYPLGLLYRCLVKSEGSADERDRVYAWICRLDPMEAMKLER